MMRWIEGESAGLLLAAVVGVLAGLGCSDSSGANMDSETHWLSACTSGADCDEGLSCLCGYCAPPCAAGSTCDDGATEGSCVMVEGSVFESSCAASEAALCVPDCVDNMDCAALGDGLVCQDDQCIPVELVDVVFPGADMGTDDGDPLDGGDDGGSFDVAPDAPADADSGHEDSGADGEADPDVTSDGDTGGFPFELCGGIAGFTCEDDFYCEFFENQCGGGDEFGVCLPRPDGCDDNVDWVCACDGTAYTNACEAQSAGYDVSQFGGCEPPAGQFPCGTGFCLTDVEYCQRVFRPNPQPDEFACVPLPGACGGDPDCDCLSGETCGGDCVAAGDGYQLRCMSEFDERFVGTWVVDQPTHALYEATVYRFGDDGRLLTLRTETFDERSDEYRTGTVGECVGEGCLACRFGQAWHAPDAEHLAIAGECSDGRYREIVLGFPADTSDDEAGVVPTIVSVGGASGWIHPDFDWRFFKCPTDEDCLEL